MLRVLRVLRVCAEDAEGVLRVLRVRVLRVCCGCAEAVVLRACCAEVRVRTEVRAHSQQAIEVQPNLDVRLVLARLLGLETCVVLDLLGHRFVQRRAFDVDNQERDQQAVREDAHRVHGFFYTRETTVSHS